MKRISLLLACMIFLAGCASNRWVRSVEEKSNSFKIYLEHYQEEESVKDQGFSHPANIESIELRLILHGLVYNEPALFSDPEPTILFPFEEVSKLASALSKCLAKADSTQRIRFVFNYWADGLIFKKKMKSEAVLFCESPSKLNIAFSYINESDDVDDNLTHKSSFRKDPLKIRSSNTPFVATNWYSNRLSDLNRRPMPLWIEVDLNMTRKIMAAKMKQIDDAIEAEAGKPVKDETASAKIEPAPIKKAASGAEKQPDSTKVMQDGEITKKLDYLKGLYEKGLIDEQEYKQKKKELLDKIK